ncbi:hypothetical protein HYZ98_04415 [Candidatus Peregrinibacteria bacterium]|nr:hypothetical protein [Candidatus Peregrinibacteria bacterium]
MSVDLRHIYANKALSQIPRLLSLLDRNPYSPTYGCFKRTYWLDKTVDFPDALPQFGVLSLSLVYTQDFPDNQYKDQPKVLEWILAGMRYWTKIQHRDGSFDEFYPNEHGWTGPTGFLLYAMLKSYMLLEDRREFPHGFKDEFFLSCRKAADYIIKWDEHGVLANHHAMAVLPVYYAYHVLKDEKLLEGYEKKLAEFLKYHYIEEGISSAAQASQSPGWPADRSAQRVGWSLEYDGADPGYLSATVSFLGKVYKLNHDERLKIVMQQSIEFLSYFVYPNGFYAGSMGSRNTLHFYPHGCEILAPEMPLAGRVADRMLESLRDGQIVPAEIMADRYFLYRIPEHLESFIDYGERVKEAKLPYEGDDFQKVFPKGRFYVQKKGDAYVIANAAKGGVLKVFNGEKLLLSDCGIIGQTVQGEVLTSQWIDPDFTFKPHGNGFSVSGSLHRVPSNKIFTPLTFIIFRLFLLLFGWHTGMAYRIKGLIRKLLMLKSDRAPVIFERTVDLKGDSVHLCDVLEIEGDLCFHKLQLGDEFFVRYVPQSRYFQSQELDCKGYVLSMQDLKRLNEEKNVVINRSF